MSQETYYLVRGAKLRCDHGSHCRQLNLPQCHGSYGGHLAQHPLMNANDYEANKNVMPFGVCDGLNAASGSPVQILAKEDGSGMVHGVGCTPLISTPWHSPNGKHQIGGASSITTKSYLLCDYGGIITPEDTGQDGPG